MRRFVEENGWYGDNTLEGDYAVLHRDSCITCNGNIIDLPEGQNVLFLTCLRWKNQVLLAGQGQYFGNWLYKDGKWKNISQSFATYPCAFSANYLYLVVGPNQYRVYDLENDVLGPVVSKAIGVNGIRYIDFLESPDGIVTGDSTYGPDVYNLSQYTKRDNIVIGQSYVDGCVAAFDQRYLLENGDTQFIRFDRNGDKICVTIVKMLEVSTVFYWMTADELKQFPVVSDIVVDPPVELPKPLPLPKPEEKKMSKSDAQVQKDQDELVRFYMEPDGLNRRARNIGEPITYNDKAIRNWFNLAMTEDIEVVKNKIKQFPEYKEQHKNENPQ